eukprot:g2386.t1
MLPTKRRWMLTHDRQEVVGPVTEWVRETLQNSYSLNYLTDQSAGLYLAPADRRATVQVGSRLRMDAEEWVVDPLLLRTDMSNPDDDTDNVLQYTIKGVGVAEKANADADVNLHFEDGGQQVNSYSWVMGAANIQNGSRFFVENVPQELDAAGEYFHDFENSTLFLVPPVGVEDPNDAQIVAALTQTIVQVKGAGPSGVLASASKAGQLVQHLHFSGLTMTMTAPTFLDLYEVPYRGGSDWTIHRGGGVFLEGLAHSSISFCTISMIGSNGVFVSNAAQNISIVGNEIAQVGESAVAIMGDLHRSTGLSALNYPLHINVSSNYMHDIGIYGKQTTGVFISTAGFVTVQDNVIHTSPSSGLKVNDNFVGGHQLNYNHIYDVCRETTDMGAVNLHNRDRFYVPFDSPVWNRPQDKQTGGWNSHFPRPVPRGPLEVDTIHWITMKGNLFETEARQGPVGKPGDWFGVQATIFCVDVDDGNGMYLITENVLITQNTHGMKIGHVVDRMNITNNIVIATDDPRINGPVSNHGQKKPLHTVPFQIGAMMRDNTMRYTNNIHVQLPPTANMSSTATGPPWWWVSNFCPFEADVPPPTTVDNNAYFSAAAADARTVVCPLFNGTAVVSNMTAWTEVGGLDAHSLFDQDPMLDTSS